MIITVIRTIIMYAFVVLALRLMGKRQIGELEPSELVVTFMISDIAALPITDLGQPLVIAVIAILLLLVLEVTLSFGAYKNYTLRSFFYGRPSTFFAKGKINQKEMENQRFSISDLMEEIRNSGASGLDEVDYVIMETNGKLSVILNSDNRPLTPKDLDIKAESTRISYIVIENGKLVDINMKRLGLSDMWLKKQLESNGISRISDVFYMGVDENGKVVALPMHKK